MKRIIIKNFISNFLVIADLLFYKITYSTAALIVDS